MLVYNKYIGLHSMCVYIYSMRCKQHVNIWTGVWPTHMYIKGSLHVNPPNDFNNAVTPDEVML